MKLLLQGFYLLEDALIIAFLFLMIALGVGQIVLRNFFDSSVVWVDPLMRHAVLWIGFLGAMIASRKDEQIRVDLMSQLVPAGLQRWLRVIVDAATAAICGGVSWFSAGFVREDLQLGQTVFAGVPLWVAESIIPIGLAVIALRYAILAVLGLMGRRSSAVADESS